MFHQEEGTAMGHKFAPPYACLAVGYLEENKLFPVLLPLHFELSKCHLIEEILERYVDDGFVIWPDDLDLELF